MYIHWPPELTDVQTLSAIWAPVVDNAVKILGGGTIGFAGAWIVARHNSQSALTKELFNRRLDMLLEASQQFETTFALWAQYLQIAEGYQSNEHEIEAIGPPERLKTLKEARVKCRDIRELWAAEVRQYEIHLSRLILLNEDKLANEATDLKSKMLYGDAFYRNHSLGSADYELLRKKTVQQRFDLIDAISRAFGKTTMPAPPDRPRFPD